MPIRLRGGVERLQAIDMHGCLKRTPSKTLACAPVLESVLQPTWLAVSPSYGAQLDNMWQCALYIWLWWAVMVMFQDES